MGHHLLKTICTWTAYAARPSAVAGAQRARAQDHVWLHQLRNRGLFAFWQQRRERKRERETERETERDRIRESDLAFC